MRREYFFDIIEPLVLTSPREIHGETISNSPHDTEFVSRVVLGAVPEDHADDSYDVDDGADDNVSCVTEMTNDESIYNNNLSEGVEGVGSTLDDTDGSDDGENYDEEDAAQAASQRADKIAMAMKRLGKKSHRNLSKYCAIDMVERGNLMLGGKLVKQRRDAIRKIERKRRLIYTSMDYFDLQLEGRRNDLSESIRRSEDPTTLYWEPPWKVQYKEYMRTVT
jgi:hypothetical protein